MLADYNYDEVEEKRPRFHDGEPVLVRNMCDNSAVVGVFMRFESATYIRVLLLPVDEPAGHETVVDRSRVIPMMKAGEA